MPYAISIIMPTYNYEKYILKSITSVVSQTIFDEIELIIVDNGSTDHSLQIIQDFTNRYENIKVITEKNKGVSTARNTGLKYSTGKYIGFIDADDWIDNEYYATLLKIAYKYNADIVSVDSNVKDNLYQETQYNRKEALQKALTEEIDVHVWSKLFRHDIIKNINFDETITIGEDRLFNLYAIAKSENIVILEYNGYHHLIHKNSAMGNIDKRMIDDNLNVSNKIIEFIQNECAELIKYAECAQISMKCRVISDILTAKLHKDDKMLYSQLYRDIMHYKITEMIKYSTKKHFLAILIIKFDPRVYKFFRKKVTKR